MLLNNVEEDVKELKASSGLSYQDLAYKFGVNRQTVYRYGIGNVITPKYIAMVEALGYDIEINYIKRDK